MFNYFFLQLTVPNFSRVVKISPLVSFYTIEFPSSFHVTVFWINFNIIYVISLLLTLYFMITLFTSNIMYKIKHNFKKNANNKVWLFFHKRWRHNKLRQNVRNKIYITSHKFYITIHSIQKHRQNSVVPLNNLHQSPCKTILEPKA